MKKYVAALATAGLAFTLAVAAIACGSSGSDSDSGPPRAVIVDQLALTQPNPDFAEAATKTLEQAGYTVDYYPGEEVTVDFYRSLPTLGYDLVILRAHSGLIQEEGREQDAFLFTSEPYGQTKHLKEQEARRLIVGAYRTDYPEDGSIELRDLPRYFGVPAEFIESSMEGSFDGATVIVMGCSGLASDSLAQALVERGAKDVVSWDGLVSAEHTDTVTERLLELVVLNGLSIEEAVEQARAELGPDPSFGSDLLSYPPKD